MLYSQGQLCHFYFYLFLFIFIYFYLFLFIFIYFYLFLFIFIFLFNTRVQNIPMSFWAHILFCPSDLLFPPLPHTLSSSQPTVIGYCHSVAIPSLCQQPRLRFHPPHAIFMYERCLTFRFFSTYFKGRHLQQKVLRLHFQYNSQLSRSVANAVCFD